MRRFSGILWFLFATLVVVTAYEFLSACGTRLGVFSIDRCVTIADPTPGADLFDRGRRLQREIERAELDIATKPACRPAGSTEQRPADQSPQRREAYERGAKRGALEVFLSWNSGDDLDLTVVCPSGGRLGARPRPGDCGGGRYDLDANKNLVENVVPNPVEHAVWDSVPAGVYQFEAMIYKPVAVVTQTVDFTMTVVFEGRERSCAGSVSYLPKSAEMRSSDGRRLAGTAKSLSWSATRPLPDCVWHSKEATYCEPSSDCPK